MSVTYPTAPAFLPPPGANVGPYNIYQMAVNAVAVGGSGLPVPIDFPPSQAGALVPMPWILLINSSPYALAIAQGVLLKILPAFTADLFRVMVVPNNDPVTWIPINNQPFVTPGGGSGWAAPTGDTSLYATWYEDLPAGQYPCAISANSIQAGGLGQTIVASSTLNNGSVLLGPIRGIPPGSGLWCIVTQTGGVQTTVSVTYAPADFVGGAADNGEAFGIIPGVTANFVLPNLGAELAITIVTDGFVNYTFVVVPNYTGPHFRDIADLSAVNASAGGFLINRTNPGIVLAASTTTIMGTASWLYAGPATLSGAGGAVYTGTSSFTPQTWDFNSRSWVSQVGFLARDFISTAFEISVPVTVPLRPYRLVFSNTTASAQGGATATVVADRYRR